MNKISKVIFYLFGNILYGLSYFFKRDPKLWLFGSCAGYKYSGNPRYLFEYLLKDKEINCFWITRNRGIYNELKNKNMPVLYRFSRLGFYYTLKAGVVVLSHGLRDINFEFLINSKVFKSQLWHGISNKKICRTANIDKYREIVASILFPYLRYYRNDMVLATSELVQDRYVDAFGISSDKIPILGYPRNDIFYGRSRCISENINVFYAPTHRNLGKSNAILDVLNKSNLSKIEKYCEKNNMKFYIKLHILDEDKIKYLDVDSTFKNIVLIKDDEKFDMQEQLFNTDVLVTDYSSIYMDYLLLDRPIIFFVFDLESYEEDDFGVYESPEEFEIGPICKSWDDLVESLDKIKEDDVHFKGKREGVRNRFYKYQDGKSCNRVYRYILNKVIDLA